MWRGIVFHWSYWSFFRIVTYGQYYGLTSVLIYMLYLHVKQRETLVECPCIICLFIFEKYGRKNSNFGIFCNILCPHMSYISLPFYIFLNLLFSCLWSCLENFWITKFIFCRTSLCVAVEHLYLQLGVFLLQTIGHPLGHTLGHPAKIRKCENDKCRWVTLWHNVWLCRRWNKGAAKTCGNRGSRRGAGEEQEKKRRAAGGEQERIRKGFVKIIGFNWD